MMRPGSFLLIGCLTLLLLAIPFTSARGDAAAEVELLKAQVESLRRENDDLRKQNGQLTAELQKLRGAAQPPETATVQAADSRTAELEQQVETLTRKLEAAETDKEDLSVEKQRLEQLAGVTAKGEHVESKIALIRSDFDAASGRTNVVTAAEKIDKPQGLSMVDHSMSLSYGYPGQKMTDPPTQVTLRLLTVQNVDDRYKQLRTVKLVVDGETIEVPVAGYRILETRSSRTAGRSGTKPTQRVDEELSLSLSMELVRKLSRATTAELYLFNSRFGLNRENLATFVAVRERIDQGI